LEKECPFPIFLEHVLKPLLLLLLLLLLPHLSFRLTADHDQVSG
jgi:hypothetical protein